MMNGLLALTFLCVYNKVQDFLLSCQKVSSLPIWLVNRIIQWTLDLVEFLEGTIFFFLLNRDFFINEYIP